MQYYFPHISHIDQVLEAIQGKSEFIVADRGDHKIVNYNVAFEDTFPPVESDSDAILRECRGIAFDKNGLIIRRPFHKFMNLGERAETGYDKIDLSVPHHILAKMDGSMIVPFDTGERIIWGTKMGDTDVAAPVQQFVERNPGYTKFFDMMNAIGYSPIFEWCSRLQRIVLDYPEDQLVLLAGRNILTGEYLSYELMQSFAEEYGIPVVTSHDTDETGIHGLANHIRDLKGIEGFVIRFDYGHMIKIKTDEYVRLHKAKELISNEKNLTLVILNNEIDDLKSFMPKEDLKRISTFEHDLHSEINRVRERIKWNACAVSIIGKKEYALGPGMRVDPLTRAAAFKLSEEWDNEIVMSYILETIRKNCNSNSNYAKLKTSWLTELKY